MHDLFIWHLDGPADLAPVKAAKAALDVDFQVRPIAMPINGNSVPMLEQFNYLTDRVLAVGSRPPFLCDYALTSERTSPEGWQRALRWVLGVEPEDPKATTVLDTLTSIFGPGTREVSQEEIDGRQRLRDYQQNRV